MFEELKKKIAHFILRRKYLQKRDHLINFGKSISSSVNFFIIMPSDDHDFNSALLIPKFLMENQKSVTLFIPEFRYNSIREKEKYKYLSYYETQKTKLNFPDKTLTDRLKQKEFDILIDLNRADSIFYSSVSNLVNSKISISLQKENAELYFNFVIKVAGADPESCYKEMRDYLRLF